VVSKGGKSTVIHFRTGNGYTNLSIDNLAEKCYDYCTLTQKILFPIKSPPCEKRIFKWIWRIILTLARWFPGVFCRASSQHICMEPHLPGGDEAPAERVAIIFGAGLRRDGSPTSILRDRVETGASLYLMARWKKLLNSGDNQYLDYNEPEAMRQYAISLGVPNDEAITLDYAGRRTYDTCYRAKAIFGGKALLVTRSSPARALFLCNALGESLRWRQQQKLLDSSL